MLLISLLFWAFLGAYIVHILDETMMNGGFVAWIASDFWPAYNARMFFWFNAGAIVVIATGNVLFDSLGGHWVIPPLILVAGFVTHLVTVHTYWTIRRNTYSPGLASGLLYAIVYYLLVRYGLQANLISISDFAVGTGVGVVTIGSFLSVGPIFLVPRLTQRS